MSRISDSAGLQRPAILSLAAAAIATAALVGLAVGNVRSADAGQAGSPASPIAAAPSTAAPTSTSSTAPKPVVHPTASADPAPSSSPDAGGRDAMPTTVDLRTFDRHAVSIDVVDRTGSMSGAVSGHPGDGTSVEASTLEVSNVDARTLRLTWIDYPIANRLALFVDEVDGHLRLLLVQPQPTGPTDAIGFDRVLILSFDRDVDAASVETMLQDGLDAAG